MTPGTYGAEAFSVLEGKCRVEVFPGHAAIWNALFSPARGAVELEGREAHSEHEVFRAFSSGLL